MTSEVLLTLTVSPRLEDTVVDWLLSHESGYGFTSFPVSGHSSAHGGLTLAEQVSGRKKQVRFQMHLPGAEVPALLDQLRRDFAGSGMHYWISPVLDSASL
ncbi:MAG TPA: DUF3240 family protein [Methylococcaceae bacterium]|nr:DUF3240 family protein [Methylococcaceae bacterium]